MTLAIALVFLSGVYLCCNQRYGWGGLCIVVSLLAVLGAC